MCGIGISCASIIFDYPFAQGRVQRGNLAQNLSSNTNMHIDFIPLGAPVIGAKYFPKTMTNHRLFNIFEANWAKFASAKLAEDKSAMQKLSNNLLQLLDEFESRGIEISPWKYNKNARTNDCLRRLLSV